MKSNRSLESSIRSILIKRLALAYVIITFFLIIIVSAIQLVEIRDLANEQAVEAVSRFNAQVIKLLQNPADIDKAAMQEELELFRSYRTHHKFGSFIYGSILDLKGGQLAFFSSENVDKEDVQQHLENFFSKHRINSDSDIYKLKFLGMVPYVYVGLPLNNSRGDLAARVEGVYSISREGYSILLYRVMRALLIALVIVTVTVLTIYPIISYLLRRLGKLTENLLESNLETLKVLGSAVSKRDSDTDEHNYRVTLIAVRIAEVLGIPKNDIRSIIKGAFLHDVGKIGIRDNILLKPGKLTDEEFEIMKTHVSHGVDVIGGSEWLDDAKDIVGYHHEKYDGTGYDRGLSGEQIPLKARIFALADVFDALSSSRPYKKPLTYSETIQILEAGRGTHFDPGVLDSFKEISDDIHRNIYNMDNEQLRAELETLTGKYFSGEITEKL